MTRRLRLLRDDERGTAAVELAMVAPVLALAMLGSLDLARAVAAKIALEQAANRAMHLADVVRPTATSGLAYINAQAARDARAALGTEPTVTSAVYIRRCGSLPVARGTTACPAGQTPIRHFEIHVRGTHPSIFVTLAKRWAGPTGNVTISAKADVRVL